LYNGEDKMTNTLKEAIEKEFPNSKNHYFLTLERYIKYKKRIN